MKQMSCCGSKCFECDCYKTLCKGCNELCGKVFYMGNNTCPIYECCVNKNGYKSCIECEKVPCEIWYKNRDPKYSDDEFNKTITDRIENLKS